MPKRVRAASRENMVPILVAIPKALRRQLAAVTAKTGITRNELVRRALVEWLERNARRKGKEVR